MTNCNKQKTKYERVGEVSRIFLRGDIWCVNFQRHGQHRRSLKTRSKKEARLRALRLERKILSGDCDLNRRAPLLTEVIKLFREAKTSQGLAKSTLRKYVFCFAQLMNVAKEHSIHRISQVTPQFMNSFRKRRVGELAKRPGRDGQKTASNDLVTIREIVNFALATKLIREDPLAGYEIKKAKTKPQPYWVQEELDRILGAATRQPHKDIYIFLGGTGMRIGEVEHLTWNDVDFDNRVVKIQEKPGWKPKTGDTRSVPMSSEVYALLGRQPRRSVWVFSFPPDSRGQARQIRQRRLLDYLKRVLKKVKLSGHLHTFRHTFISLALTRGIPEATVRSWVGHVDAEIIRRYTHIASQESHAAMAKLDASIQSRRSPSQ